MTDSRQTELMLLIILFVLILLSITLLLFAPTRSPAGSIPGAGLNAGAREEAEAEALTPQEVREALLRRPDLIPFEGTLGGTMGFYIEENITVLNDRWVYARFEDGHIAGSMLLEYESGGRGIRWRVLAAELDGR